MKLNLIFAIVLMAITGFFDGLAFGRAPKIRNYQGLTRIIDILKTLSIFGVGLITYIASTFFLYQQGVENALVITLIWFVVTIISLAIISGSFFTLSISDKVIALVAIILVGILYYRGVAK